MALLSVRGLTKRFDGLVANSEIDLDVPEGSLFAVIGPNGAGKTTFFNMLSGFLAPTAGTIALDGKDITRVSQDKIAAMGLIRTFQLVQMFQGMSAAENVEVGFHLRTRELDRLQDAPLVELSNEPGLTDRRQVRRMASGDSG